MTQQAYILIALLFSSIAWAGPRTLYREEVPGPPRTEQETKLIWINLELMVKDGYRPESLEFNGPREPITLSMSGWINDNVLHNEPFEWHPGAWFSVHKFTSNKLTLEFPDPLTINGITYNGPEPVHLWLEPEYAYIQVDLVLEPSKAESRSLLLVEQVER